MTTIALFHSALGVRPGVLEAEARFRSAGHDVLVVDQYGGRSFDDYDEAQAHVESLGFPALMRAALGATADLPAGFVAVGFSNGAGMAEYVALNRRVSGAVLFSGALPLAILGGGSWPSAVPVQLHYAADDPFRDESWISGFLDDVRSSGARTEHFDYPGGGHLFTDPSRAREYDAAAAELAWQRALAFVDELPPPSFPTDGASAPNSHRSTAAGGASEHQ